MGEPLYILMPVHNRRAVTARMAEALRGQTRQDFQLVLIDDGSTDGTADAVRAVLPSTVVIRGDGNGWWAGCLQRGCEWLAAQAVPGEAAVCILNDDVDIGPDFLELALAEIAACPDTLLLPRQRPAEGGEIPGGGGVRFELAKLRFAPVSDPAAVNCLPTRGLFLRWRDVQRTGEFRPGLLPHYFSDYEFTYRAHRRGLRLRVAAKASLILQPDTGWSRADLFSRPRRERFPILGSRRFKENPWARTALVWLAAPLWLRPWLLVRVWGGFGLLALRCLVTPVAKPAPGGGRTL